MDGHSRKSSISKAQQSLVHWYKTHQQGYIGTESVFGHTEEPEKEYVVEAKRYHKSCCPLCSPYLRFYMRVTKIRIFRHYIQSIFEETFKTIRWIDLPGGQQQAAVDRNYMMNYIWLMSFLTNDIDTGNKDSARHIRFRFEEVLINAETVGLLVQQYFEPLKHLGQNFTIIESIGELVQMKVPRLTVERKIFTLPLKPDDTILPGNQIRDFSKLLCYVRKESQVWSKFRTLPESDKVDIVTKGLTDISDNLKELKTILKSPLKGLRAATRGCTAMLTHRPTLVRHVRKLKTSAKGILNRNRPDGFENEDKKIVAALLTEISSHYGYVMRFGEMIVEEVWDIILMIRLSYNFLKESPQNSLNIASHEAVMLSKFKQRKVKKLLRASNFTLEDFYRTECPDTLRKLPVVIQSRNTELSLHLQGHRNTSKSKASTTVKRFTIMKRMTAAAVERRPNSQTSIHNGQNGLLFVSEGE
ncbi:unnamed protein product [Orchesella dallaii]|uniref:Uncharacterized protein n=1 Tax=Orchesella dallaii TaxID=48710 RepID=A0ABP1QGH5_9HEXA